MVDGSADASLEKDNLLGLKDFRMAAKGEDLDATITSSHSFFPVLKEGAVTGTQVFGLRPWHPEQRLRLKLLNSRISTCLPWIRAACMAPRISATAISAPF